MPTLIECLVFVFCFWQGLDIINQWDSSPYIQMADLSFAIWIIPFFIYWIFLSKKKREINTSFLLLAIISTTIGMLGSMNAFEYLGLSLAICGLTPLSFLTFLWFLTSALWMPASAYFLSSLEPDTVILIRLTLTTLGALIASGNFIFRRKPYAAE